MYIGKRPSGGRGEFEIAEPLAGGELMPADLVDRPIWLDCGPFGIRPTNVELRIDASQAKLRLRRTGTGGMHLHRQVVAMLMLPRSIREESRLPAGEPVVMVHRYLVRRIDIVGALLTPAGATPAGVTFDLGTIELVNQSMNAQEHFRERLVRIKWLQQNAAALPPTLGVAVAAHASMLASSNALGPEAERLVDETMRFVADAAADYDLDYTFGTDVLPTLEAMLAPAPKAEPVPIDQIPDDELELRRREVSRWRRMAAARGYPAFVFRSKVQTAYRQTCVVCGLRFPKSSHCPVPGVDAAHIQPWSKVDLDTLANGLCLCKMHHWAFDQRLIAIRPDPSGHGYVVIVTETAARALAADPASLAALEAHAGPIPRGRLPAAIADWPSVALLERFYEAVRPDLE